MQTSCLVVRLHVILAISLIALGGSFAWGTARIQKLEAKVAQLEASHYALGRHTYDFGNAMLKTNSQDGLSPSQLAKHYLNSMGLDKDLGPVVLSDRNKRMLISALGTARHNVIDRLTE
jgi:hypothetical protein